MSYKRSRPLRWALLHVLAITSVAPLCQAADGDPSVEASAGAPAPNPAFVNEQIIATLGAKSSEPTVQAEAHLTEGPLYSWGVKKVESKASSTDEYAVAPSGHSVAVQEDTGGAATGAAKLVCSFSAAAFWKVTLVANVTYKDNLGKVYSDPDGGEVVVNMIAGDWVQVTPDVLVPQPMAASDSGSTIHNVTQTSYVGTTTYHAGTTTWHRSPQWVKSHVWGSGAGADNQPLAFTSPTQNNAATKWDVKVRWKPEGEGSTPRRQLFDGNCSWKLTLQVEGDVDNYNVMPPDGTGKTVCHASITVTPEGSGTSSGANPRATGDVDKSESGTPSWSITIGLPPLSVSNDDGNDEWNEGKPDQGTAPFNIDSGSLAQVGLKAEMTSDAMLSWANHAEGPFLAFAPGRGDIHHGNEEAVKGGAVPSRPAPPGGRRPGRWAT